LKQSAWSLLTQPGPLTKVDELLKPRTKSRKSKDWQIKLLLLVTQYLNSVTDKATVLGGKRRAFTNR